ncbi:hypothetical protein ACFSQ7_31320 [Paenibacillus rhizoplanae]
MKIIFRPACGWPNAWKRWGRREAAFTAVTRTLQYDAPRAEGCCRLGGWHLDKGQLHQAIYWFELALQLPGQAESMAMKKMRPSPPGFRICSSRSVMTGWASMSGPTVIMRLRCFILRVIPACCITAITSRSFWATTTSPCSSPEHK